VSTPRFRSFSPGLQRFFLATVVNMTGSGMIFAFLFIYLNEVRNFSGTWAGLIVASTPIAGVVINPWAGYVSDRFGPRRILAIGCIVSIGASSSLAFASTVPLALVASVAMGVANGLWFPSQSALLSVIVTAEERPSVMAFQRTALNLGAGFGGVLGGLIADRERLGSFQLMFAINAATYVMFLACLPGLPSGRVVMDPAAVDAPLGFRDVLRDRFFLLLLASDLGISFGFGFAWGMMPAYASRIGVNESTVGLMFLVGAISAVVFQIPMLRWVRGRDRMLCLSFMNATFLVAFVITSFTVNTSIGIAIAVMIAAQAIGGFGETVLAAVRQPLTSELAPISIVGRYFGLASMVFQGSMGAAAAIGGVLLDHSLRSVWIVAAGFSAYGVVTSLALRHRLGARVALAA
jgi:MFS family permease